MGSFLWFSNLFGGVFLPVPLAFVIYNMIPHSLAVYKKHIPFQCFK